MEEGWLAQLKEALVRFHREGAFGEQDYQLLRRSLSKVAGARAGPLDLLDGLVNLFFERHLMDDRRRKELLALDDAELFRALRHRFRQVIADEKPDVRPYHALVAHVREALGAFPEDAQVPEDATWPVGLRTKDRYDRALVAQAVAALWREHRARPIPAAATRDLLGRYQVADPEEITETHDVPEAIRRRLDGQRLAAQILELLTHPERDLLRHVLDGGSVEEWGEDNGCSRATAYRLMARLKTLCKLEFNQRSNCTQLEALQALKGRLGVG